MKLNSILEAKLKGLKRLSTMCLKANDISNADLNALRAYVERITDVVLKRKERR